MNIYSLSQCSTTQDIINTAEAQKLKEAAEGLMMKKTDQVTLRAETLYSHDARPLLIYLLHTHNNIYRGSRDEET